MKKNLLVVFALILGFVTSVSAQDSNPDKVKFGLKIGTNLTTLGVFNFDGEKYDYTYKPGFTAGAFSEIPLKGKFKLLAEINYSQKGGDVEGGEGVFKMKLEQRLIYIDVPIAISYQALPNINIFLGPQVSFIQSQSSKTTRYLPGVTSVDTETSTDKVANAIPGGIIGLSFQLSNINLSGRYMTDLSKGSKDNDPMFAEVKNSGFALTVGYTF